MPFTYLFCLKCIIGAQLAHSSSRYMSANALNSSELQCSELRSELGWVGSTVDAISLYVVGTLGPVLAGTVAFGKCYRVK
jgi:hypothetical protein